MGDAVLVRSTEFMNHTHSFTVVKYVLEIPTAVGRNLNTNLRGKMRGQKRKKKKTITHTRTHAHTPSSAKTLGPRTRDQLELLQRVPLPWSPWTSKFV